MLACTASALSAVGTATTPTATPTAAPTPPALAAAQARAAALRLSEAPYWRVLLHCRPGLTGWRSLIDDPAFFLHPDGKRDPQAELQATLSALWAAPVPGEPHATDRFPARLEWLVEQLDLPRQSLPVPRCAEVEKVLERIQPKDLSLIFPSAYMNSPASMFGHTLLCIKSQFDSKLLDHAINYAADVQDTNGFVFAFKGIFGLYDGRYTVVPYYAKVEQYNAIDQRDIWEYGLNLTPAEARRLMLHVWEIRNTVSRYFFFDENCSYNLLFLLDAARPGLRLHRQARPWVIPLDTVRLVRAAGLITTSTCRPSRAAQLYRLAEALDDGPLDLAQAICRGTAEPAAAVAAPWPAETQARCLEVAAAELRLRYHSRRLTQAEYTPRYLAILRTRSRLPAIAAMPEPPAPTPPDYGHRSMRLSLGAGSLDGQAYAELAWRPAYHDELDPGLGYLAGSQIEFFNVAARLYEGEDEPELHRLDAVRVQSLAPRDRFFTPTSWKADVGLRRVFLERPGDDTLAAYASPGVGLAWALTASTLAYVMAETELLAGRLDGGWALGAGTAAGVYQQLTPACRLQLAGRAMHFMLGDRHSDVEVWLAQRWQVGANQALSARLSLHHGRGENRPAAGLTWHWYF